MNTGLLLLRLALALPLSGHAVQKLFGSLHGAGPRGAGELFESWGFAPGPALAVLAGCCELAGAAALGAAAAVTPLARRRANLRARTTENPPH